LFFFGGATLKDFAFALLVGVTSGAYSSIFIAAPIVTLWKQREPEYARRRGTTPDEADALRTLQAAEVAAAAEPTPETPVDAVIEAFEGNGEDDAAKRERRRQRRRSRPHGRAR
jgi:SecD/SecF fusion protein